MERLSHLETIRRKHQHNSGQPAQLYRVGCARDLPPCIRRFVFAFDSANNTAGVCRFIKRLSPGGQYAACKGSEQMTSRASASCERSDGRELAQRCVVPASVLQGVVSSHFAGRFRFW